MKKLLVSLSLILTALVGNATPESVFDFNETEMTNEFKKLDKIESYIEVNEGITYGQLIESDSELLTDVTLLEDTSAVVSMKDMPILGAFWWGCCLGILGLALVYFITDNDKAQLKSALIGCVLNAIIFGGAWGFFGNPATWF